MAPNPKRMPTRVVVYGKDVENMTGKQEHAARRLLQRIRKAFGKPKDGFVTIREFSLYTGIDEDLVREFLID